MTGNPAKEPKPYILGPNDVIDVNVWGTREVSGQYAIGPDGRLSMHLVGSLFVSGQTLEDVKAAIADKLEESGIRDPIVNVQLLRNNSKKYTILGGMNHTGTFPLLSETTILEAIGGAGGFKEFANKSRITLRRGSKIYPFDYKAVSAGKKLEQNLTIEDGDVINVPE